MKVSSRRRFLSLERISWWAVFSGSRMEEREVYSEPVVRSIVRGSDTETIEEVSDEDPCAVSVDAFLDTQFHDGKVVLELRFGDAIQQGRFFDDLGSAQIEIGVPDKSSSRWEGTW